MWWWRGVVYRFWCTADKIACGGWYCWCLQCLIWVCRLWAAAGKKGLTCISSNNSSSSSSRSRSCCAGRRSCSSFHSGNSPPLGPTLYTTCLPRLGSGRPKGICFFWATSITTPRHLPYSLHFSNAMSPHQRCLCDKSVNLSDLIWSKKKHQGFNNLDTREAWSNPSSSSYPKKHVAVSLPSVCV